MLVLLINLISRELQAPDFSPGQIDENSLNKKEVSYQAK